MYYLLFTCYLIIFCWLITRTQFFKKSQLGNRILIALFLVKVFVGLINAYINLYYLPVSDSVAFHLDGIQEYHLLFQNPWEYFTNIFQTGRHSYGNLLESSNSYWNDTRSNLIIKMLSVFDIFSRTNFFINSLFYNFLVFFGPVALYRVFIKIFPAYKYVLIICIFLLPSVIFFSSGIHRDGLIYLSLSMVIHHLFFMMKNNRYPLKQILITLLFLLIIFLIRNFVFIILTPPLVAWIISEKRPNRTPLIFAGIYLVVGILFFSTVYLPPAYNLPAHVSSRQTDFIEIAKNGASAIKINPLYPNFRSFLINIPQALNHSFLRPYLSEHNNLLYIPSSVEIFLFEILLLLFIFFRKRNATIYPIVYFSVFFTLTTFIVIGYTIPILGAIVRYRSIYFPFIIIPIVCYTDWAKFKARFHIKI